MDCEDAWVVFPEDRVLVAGRWRAAYQFGLLGFTGEDPSELVRGVRQPEKPVELRRISGSVETDLMGTDWATLLLVSDRLVDLLRAVSATGWSVFPVNLRTHGNRPLSGYHGLSVTGRAGPIRKELGRDVLLGPFAPSGKAVPGTRGWCFDPETWDGSGVFTPEGAEAFCVTTPVADVLRDSGVTGPRLERMSEIEMITV